MRTYTLCTLYTLHTVYTLCTPPPLHCVQDFGDMNEEWIKWIDPENKPVRACVEAPMAHPDILFEVMVIAAK